MFCHGWSDKEVADRLSISYETVRVHKKSIYRKKGVTKDTELVMSMVCERLKRPFTIRKLRTKGIAIIDDEPDGQRIGLPKICKGMKRVKKYMNGTSAMFSNLAGERVTRKEVIAAHVGCAAVIIGAMSENIYMLSTMLAIAGACVFLNIRHQA